MLIIFDKFFTFSFLEMTDSLLESLLHQDESQSLHFKRDQYPFDHATDDEKNELLKDIITFANSWGSTDAHILIGVERIKGFLIKRWPKTE